MTVGPAPSEPAHYTEAELLARLRVRYSAVAGNGPRWVFMAHVRDRAGFDATRTLDAIVMDTWPSSGLALHGFEIKVSRSDWRRELARPDKAEAFARYMDYFWVVAPRGVVKDGELPERFGLLEPRGAGLFAATRATRLRLRPTFAPLDRSLVACMLRSAGRV